MRTQAIEAEGTPLSHSLKALASSVGRSSFRALRGTATHSRSRAELAAASDDLTQRMLRGAFAETRRARGNRPPGSSDTRSDFCGQNRPGVGG